MSAFQNPKRNNKSLFCDLENEKMSNVSKFLLGVDVVAKNLHDLYGFLDKNNKKKKTERIKNTNPS